MKLKFINSDENVNNRKLVGNSFVINRLVYSRMDDVINFEFIK